LLFAIQPSYGCCTFRGKILLAPVADSALAAMMREGGGQSFFRLGAYAEIGVGFCEEDLAVFCDDVGGWDGETPAFIAIKKRQVDQDGLVVSAVILRDGVDEAEFFSECIAGIGEDREGKAMLAGHEIALALRLRADGDHEGFVLADGSVEITPGFKLSDAVGAPAAAKEFDDEGAKSEHVFAADDAAGSVVEFEVWSDGADGENVVFNAGGEQLSDSALAYGKALLLDEVTGVGSDLVELVLKCGH
jgi:hypothetical protein